MHGIMENDFMFSGRGEVPWHGIGAVLDGVLTSEQAIKEARLTWTVEQKRPYMRRTIGYGQFHVLSLTCGRTRMKS